MRERPDATERILLHPPAEETEISMSGLRPLVRGTGREGMIDGTAEDARYRRLWLSVIHRAKLDADGQDLMVDTEEEVPVVVNGAKEYLTNNSPDLQEVCEFAGVSVDKVLSTFRDRKKFIWAHRRRY
jgi:hypothetical protein